MRPEYHTPRALAAGSGISERTKPEQCARGTSGGTLAPNLNVGALAVLAVTLPPGEQDLSGTRANPKAESQATRDAKPGARDAMDAPQLQSHLCILLRPVWGVEVDT